MTISLHHAIIQRMMIVLTKQDLSKMSPDLRHELMQIIFSTDNELDVESINSYQNYDATGIDHNEHQQIYNEVPEYIYTENGDSGNKTRVITINEREAKELVSNLSDKSIEMLKKFTSPEPVLLSYLIGEDKPYENFAILKRSFVGPVNRRLRTVTKNKNAKLFIKIDGEAPGIAVKEGTRTSLMKIFDGN